MIGTSMRAGAVVLACLLLCVPADARKKDSAKPIVDGALGKKLDAAVLEGGGRDFWGSVLVAKKGKILLAKGYGKADYVKEPNTPLTLFELASTSKQFAAVAILQLQQKKKLKVTDTLDAFFSKKAVPKDKRGITLHHLLTHTSGISGNVGVSYADPIPLDRYVEKMLREPLDSGVGETFAYCNVGYALLVFSQPVEACGCFGSALHASYYRRLTLAGAMLFLGAGAMNSLRRRRMLAGMETEV